jgi:hypothetical protein
MAEQPHTVSDRGFRHFDEIPSKCGGGVRTYESSAASGPHVWVSIECPEDLNRPLGVFTQAVAHLTLDDATRLRDQLTWLIENHYQLAAFATTGEETS